MRPDPAEEWQRLAKLYGEMSDEQLQELAASFSDLTEFAQPILRDEMKKRGLDEPLVALQPEPDADRHTPFARMAPRFAGSSDPSPNNGDEDGEAAPAHEYTWKTDLCVRDTSEEAWQIAEVLRLAGIESWPDRAGSSFGTKTVASEPVGILVAADQLDEARAVIAKPIPQDIIDQSKAKVEEFVPPACPQCGAPDPLLESVEPANTWRCEVCDATWSDSAIPDVASSEPVS